MGCDYYIYTALKIVHNGGIEHVVLKEEKVYLPPGYDNSDDDIAVHPQRRLPKIDHMKVDCDDVLVFKKGEPEMVEFRDEYKTIAEEQIKSNLDEKYKSTNKYVKGMYFWGFHLDSGDFLKSMDDINEMYIIEARKWRG
jgi:predicted glutamine amidotransferase